MRNLLWIPVNAAQWTLVWAWHAAWITLAGLVLLVTRDQEKALGMARRYWAPGVLRIFGIRLTVTGAETVDPSRPCLFVLNHQSAADIPVTFASLPVNLRFIAKREALFVPFIGLYMWATGMVFVDRRRTKHAIASLERAAQRIRDGAHVIAYPEGTRSRDGFIGPFKKGAFVVAIRAGVPVVPVAIAGARDNNPPGTLRLRPAHVRVQVGEAVPTEGMSYDDREALIDRVRQGVLEASARIGGPGPRPSAGDHG